MKRKVSNAFKKARREMIESRTRCRECENYATELHHIVAVEDGGTDDIRNLMPLCEECHKEYTSEQISERNKLWVELSIDDNGDVTAQCEGDKDWVTLGKIQKETGGKSKMTEKTHYEYEWIVTVEIPATSERESKEKLQKFKSELFSRYAVTDDVWLTGIRRWNGNE